MSAIFYANSFPPFHCYWCGIELKLPAVACRAHDDVERLYQAMIRIIEQHEKGAAT